ncbi:DUF6160 family protein [Acinetobacter beijerinckii]|uniref:DUF6160 family protein n=1 Tax=Acinetobacter beijerinckii TaxID=262668 RepID=UPI003AF6172A
MYKNKKMWGLSLLLISPFTIAMQPMDDTSLASTVGQDGISIAISNSKIEFNQISVIDNDGFSYGGYTAPNYTGRAGLIIAGIAGQTPNNALKPNPVAIVGLDSSNADTLLPTLNAIIDSDKGVGTKGAFVNINLSFSGNYSGFRIKPFSIYSANSSNLSSVIGGIYTKKTIFDVGSAIKLQSGVKEILRINDNLDIKFIASNKPTVNLQFGAAPQGHMAMFGGAIDSICGSTASGCNMMLVSDYTTVNDSTTAPIGASFDFQLKATNSTTGFRLNGFYGGIEGQAGAEAGGFVFGNNGVTDQFNLNLNNIKLGNAADSANFNGLNNGSIGSLGMVGTSISNLKMKISGM